MQVLAVALAVALAAGAHALPTAQRRLTSEQSDHTPQAVGLGHVQATRAEAPAVVAAAQTIAPAAPATTQMSIVVPAGAAVGQGLLVNTPGGQQMQVVVPPGAVPGQQLIVNVPAMSPPPPAPVLAMPPLPTPPAMQPQLVTLTPPPPPQATPPTAPTASAAVHKLTLPDGGTLVDLVVPPAELPAKRIEAASLPTLSITALDRDWLHVLADGWASPLKGFMTEAEYLQCLHFGHVKAPDGTLASQSVPIVLALSEADKTRLAGSDAITLVFNGTAAAIMRKPEFFEHRAEEREGRTWGYTTPGIPYIDLINQMGPWLVGGELEVLGPVLYHDGLDEYRKSPAALRAEFEKRGADAVFAFQLRNPVHNGHALLMTTTRENLIKEGYKNPVLLLHPLGGWTKSDDVPLDIRMKQHFAVIQERALDPDSTVLAIWPSPMSYSGPNEVLWHAKSRIAAGVTHYIVGRDPAGMKHPVSKEDLYESSHGRKVLELCPGMMGKMTFVGFKPAAYDKTKQKMSFIDPSRKDDFISISGTKMRKYARGEMPDADPPAGFMAPSAWKIVKDYYSSLQG